MIVHNEVSRDAEWIYGETYEIIKWDRSLLSRWVRMVPKSYEKTFWYLKEPHEVLKILGIDTTVMRAREYTELANGEIDAWYYVNFISNAGKFGNDEALKWIMSSVAAKLKERNLGFESRNQIIEPKVFREFIRLLSEDKIPKTFVKDIFDELCATCYDIENIYMDAETYISIVLENPKYKEADSSDIDAVITTVIAANMDQALKAKENPKLSSWFIGQVLKASGAKINPAMLKELIQKQIDAL